MKSTSDTFKLYLDGKLIPERDITSEVVDF